MLRPCWVAQRGLLLSGAKGHCTSRAPGDPAHCPEENQCWPLIGVPPELLPLRGAQATTRAGRPGLLCVGRMAGKELPQSGGSWSSRLPSSLLRLGATVAGPDESAVPPGGWGSLRACLFGAPGECAHSPITNIVGCLTLGQSPAQGCRVTPSVTPPVEIRAWFRTLSRPSRERPQLGPPEAACALPSHCSPGLNPAHASACCQGRQAGPVGGGRPSDTP